MKTVSIFIAAVSILIAQSAKAKPTVEANRQFAWVEVPGTAIQLSTENPYLTQFSWYMNINRLVREGETIVFEVASPEAQYYRVQGNCRNQQLLVQFQGEFESETKIVYQPVSDSWHTATGLQQRLLNFACSNDGGTSLSR
ncbi:MULTISPECIES: hypothetical protein [Aerosakkonema]|uniref:hypothetical protein n=1 Tax=Aerosakkonema TaxID=1246629 RepID=UPI0035BB9252